MEVASSLEIEAAISGPNGKISASIQAWGVKEAKSGKGFESSSNQEAVKETRAAGSFGCVGCPQENAPEKKGRNSAGMVVKPE